MTIDLKTVKHISKLSRISIEEDKAKKLSNDLNLIFNFIDYLAMTLGAIFIVINS